MLTSLRLVCAFAIAVQLFATGVEADPIRVTAGTLSFDTGGPPTFSLVTASGQLLEAEGFRLNWPAGCYCAPGVAVPLSIFPTSVSDGSMFFAADGVELFPVMDLAIWSPSVTLGSDVGTREGPVEVFRRPFTFAGQLAGYASPDLIGAPIFNLTLTGSGTARLSMEWESGRYSFSSLDYDFAADPVPEPATLLLVGTGAALIWRRRARTCRGQARPNAT